MKQPWIQNLPLLIALLLFNEATAEDIDLSTSPLGFNRVDCPAGSDTAVSNPFHRTPSFTGAVQTTSSSASSVRITSSGTNSFSSGFFTTTPHYLRFKDSAGLAGKYYEVTSNDSQTVTIEISSSDLSSLRTGDPFDIIPHWTLGTLFPKETQNAIHVSTGLFPPDRQTRLFLSDITSDGIDLAPNRIFFLTTEGWHEARSGFPAADDVIIPPGHTFFIRHPDSVDDTTFFAINAVLREDHETSLRTRKEGPQDNHLGIIRPLPVKLTDLDLSGFADSTSTSALDRKDEVRLFNNEEESTNKEPDIVYFRVGGQWRKDDGSSYPVSNDAEIPPSAAIVIRKAATPTGNPQTWRNSPRY